RAAELMLADMDTEHGLQAAELGRDREAVLWFAKAAQVSARDPVRRRANGLRTLGWSRRLSRPVAVLLHPSGVPLTLTFHPRGERRPLPTRVPPWSGILRRSSRCGYPTKPRRRPPPGAPTAGGWPSAPGTGSPSTASPA